MKLGFLASTLAIVSLAATPAIADSVFERKTAPTERENKIGAAAGIGLAVAAAAAIGLAVAGGAGRSDEAPPASP